MYGDNAERATPRHIARLLEEYGGKTPTGLPAWRLVRAEDCRILCQGTIHHFPRGVETDVNTVPLRIQGGQFLMPRYRDKAGWILQKWFPPSTWGTAEEWHSHRGDAGDTRLFVASFPSQGDYYMLGGPWGSIEAAGDLRPAILSWLRAQSTNPTDLESFVEGELTEDKYERQRVVERFKREMDAVLRTDVLNLLQSASVTAQSFRDQVAAETGTSAYLSASETY